MNRRVAQSGLVLAAVLMLAAGCQTTNTTSGGAVGVDRQQTMLVSAAEVNRQADKAYQETINEARAKKTLNRNPERLGARARHCLAPDPGDFGISARCTQLALGVERHHLG